MDNFFECYIWWLLLGLLLGFVLFWLYDLLFRRDGETLVRKYETQIAALTKDTSQLEDDLANTKRTLAEFSNEKDKVELAAKMGFSPFKNGKDNLTIIEGIGPKINALLVNNDVPTFASLESTDVANIQTILNNAGSAYKLAKPESWPKQAGMCVRGEWEELKRYQDQLVGGIEFD